MIAKTVYLYDEKTGEYKEQYNAQPSPLFNPEKHSAAEAYILPVHATDVIPPATGKGKIAIFKNRAWEIVPDYRGQYAFNVEDGQSLLISEIGEIPANLSLTPPIPTIAQQAMQALNKVTGANGTIMRCVTAGIAVPDEWSAYVTALRSLLAEPADSKKPMPVQPAYPEGS